MLLLGGILHAISCGVLIIVKLPPLVMGVNMKVGSCFVTDLGSTLVEAQEVRLTNRCTIRCAAVGALGQC